MDNVFKQKLQEIANQLQIWAAESINGGWSTHQVKPMKDLASQIYVLINGACPEYEANKRHVGFMVDIYGRKNDVDMAFDALNAHRGLEKLAIDVIKTLNSDRKNDSSSLVVMAGRALEKCNGL